MVTLTWQSQDVCALSRHYERVQATGINTYRRTDMSLSWWVWAPKVPPGPLADIWDMTSEFAPQKIAGPYHSWVNWCGKVLSSLPSQKVFICHVPHRDLNSQTYDYEPTAQPLSHQ